MASKQHEIHKGLYYKRCRGAELEVGDLVRQRAWKGRHKPQHRWENEEYQIMGQPTPGIPACEVQCLDGGNQGFSFKIYFHFTRAT